MKKLLSVLLAAVLFFSATITNPNDYPNYTPPQTGIEQIDDNIASNETEESEQVSPCDDSESMGGQGDAAG